MTNLIAKLPSKLLRWPSTILTFNLSDFVLFYKHMDNAGYLVQILIKRPKYRPLNLLTHSSTINRALHSSGVIVLDQQRIQTSGSLVRGESR